MGFTEDERGMGKASATPTEADLLLWRKVRAVLQGAADVSAEPNTERRRERLTSLGHAVLHLGVTSSGTPAELGAQTHSNLTRELGQLLDRISLPVDTRDCGAQAQICWCLYVADGNPVGVIGRRVGSQRYGYINGDWRSREKTAAERMWRSDRVGDFTLRAWPGISGLIDVVFDSFGLGRDDTGPRSSPKRDVARPIPGDVSEFLADITVPDGTAFDPDEPFVKIWRIRNAGSVPWHGRWLHRLGSPSGPGNHWSLPRVPIPETWPGSSTDIEIEMRAATLAGTSVSEWKMVDSSGQLYFPDRYKYGLRCETVTRGNH